MLVFFYVCLGLGIILLILALSTLQIQFDNIKIVNNKIIEGKIKLVLKFLKIFSYFELDLLESKFFKYKMKLDNIQKNLTKEKMSKYKIETKEFLNITDVEELYIKIDLQGENIILLSFVIVILSTILSVIMAKNNLSKEFGKYKVNLNYNLKPMYELNISSVFNIKFIHIISIMCENLRKRRVKENANKSYRRSYGHNYE